jgi:O-antigen ligase
MKSLSVKIYDYLFAALLLLMPFSMALPNIVIALLVLLFVADYKSVDYKRLRSLPVIMLYAFLAYYFIRGAITGALFIDWNIYKKLIILFIMPVLFLKVRQAQVVKAGVVAGVMLSIIASVFLTAKYYMQFSSLPFLSGEAVNKLLLLERPYAGFYAIMGVIFSFDLISSYPKYKKWLLATSITAILFIVVISARISFITLIFLAGTYILFYLRISNVKKAALVTISLLAVVLTFVLNKNIAERFFIKANVEQAILASDYEPRLVIWPCAYSLIKNDDFNPVFGYPDNTVVTNHYVDCYKSTILNNESKKAYFVETKFNSHNQFIDIFLTGGLVGLLLFVLFFACSFFKVRYSYFDTALLIAMVFFLLVENVLHRQTGCYIFSIFAALLLIRNNLGNEKN